MLVLSKVSPMLQPRGWQRARSQSPSAHLRPTVCMSFYPAYCLGPDKRLNKRIRVSIIFLAKKIVINFLKCAISFSTKHIKK